MMTDEYAKLQDVISVLTDYHANGAYKKLKENVTLLSEESYAVMIRTTNFEANNYSDNLVYIDELAYNFLSKSKVYPHDILMNKIAKAGEVYYMPDLDKPVSLGMNLFLIRIDKKKADPYFIYSYLKKNECYVKSYASGSTTKTITKEDVRKLKIFLPPLKEQIKISQILSTWDKAIILTEKLIINRKAQKKALMQKLLSGNENCKKYSIKDMGDIILGGTPDTKNQYYWDGDIFWATPTDITALNNRYIYKTNRKITKEAVNNSSLTVLPKKSLLVCTRATVGYLAISKNEMATNQGFKNLIPNKHFDVEYLYYLFFHFRELFERYACGSTFLELSKKDFSKLNFLCPDLDEQKKIASILSAADKDIEAFQRKLAFFKQEKKALMQQLLSGKRRVNLDKDKNHSNDEEFISHSQNKHSKMPSLINNDRSIQILDPIESDHNANYCSLASEEQLMNEKDKEEMHHDLFKSTPPKWISNNTTDYHIREESSHYNSNEEDD